VTVAACIGGRLSDSRAMKISKLLGGLAAGYLDLARNLTAICGMVGFPAYLSFYSGISQNTCGQKILVGSAAAAMGAFGSLLLSHNEKLSHRRGLQEGLGAAISVATYAACEGVIKALPHLVLGSVLAHN
jgi:hypothetical protein